ncbi:hypothetical protein PRIPAC_83044 [Pristionchus pacificus]|uniref:Uncharacterized protein n=1 Tax=Pristionchus pacificus TaxID=54126 RepID=A0A2A6BHU6_PRIPA|nr:hypothetical protein PRIPAC_83044 [Pristionchus pacificus]|eukprot:PDM65447.1 hypothetical protein PRIPAC_52389 [Pristionchus pacificus]
MPLRTSCYSHFVFWIFDSCMSVLDTYDSLNKTSKRMKIRILDDAADPRVLRCIIFDDVREGSVAIVQKKGQEELNEFDKKDGNYSKSSMNWSRINENCEPYGRRILAPMFRDFGTARLLIVVKYAGSGGMPGLMRAVSRGLKSGRLERLLIVTDEPISARDRRANYHMFMRNNITINYSSISQENLFH